VRVGARAATKRYSPEALGRGNGEWRLARREVTDDGAPGGLSPNPRGTDRARLTEVSGLLGQLGESVASGRI
jgi:hypothetical protein